MSTELFYMLAIRDFRDARRKVALRAILSRLSGKSTELLSYEEVRQKLQAVDGNKREFREIPLDAIVGSVGRYNDFTRDFLPRRDSDEERWARVMTRVSGLTGLSPIDVYQVGEVYFVLDGNHRVSVAQQLGATHIQARVTEMRTRVPLTPDTQPDELIIKAEYVNFLKRTHLDEFYPQADLSVTIPGQYPILEEHISVHRYFMGIERQKPIPYDEAVTHWYTEVYLPAVQLIRDLGILRSFPKRFATDLYLWLSKHKADLETKLGWEIETEVAAEDLASHFGSKLSQVMFRTTARILDAVTPDALESGPPPGKWRQEQLTLRRDDHLFADILITHSGSESGWQAFEQAVIMAKREGARLRGLHIVTEDSERENKSVLDLQAEFKRRCQEAGVPGELAIATGTVARQICERSRWTDIVVSPLSHPPDGQFLTRLESGFRIMIQRCPKPILAVPGAATNIEHALLAFDGSRKAREALFVATYLTSQWSTKLSVVTVIDSRHTHAILDKARDYLERHDAQAEYIAGAGNIAKTILKTAARQNCDLIIIGGYGLGAVLEVALGSVVDQVLREAQIPILICR